MRNLLILGAARSGTSMLAGCLAAGGYFMGGDLIERDAHNPRGYFETVHINRINERLLGQAVPSIPQTPRAFRRLYRYLYRGRFAQGERWLASVPVGATIVAPPSEERHIRALTRQVPYCLKDPRLSYTLSAWRPSLHPDTAFVCVFRDPSVTAQSIRAFRLSHVARPRPPLSLLGIMESWRHTYEHVLQVHRHEGDWLFLHYDQIMDGSALSALAAFSGAPVDGSFPEPSLRRSRATVDAPAEVLATYRALGDLAGYDTVGRTSSPGGSPMPPSPAASRSGRGARAARFPGGWAPRSRVWRAAQRLGQLRKPDLRRGERAAFPWSSRPNTEADRP